MRIGAAAAERLGLFQLRALNFYRTWPKHVGRDPMQRFISVINEAGTLLTHEERLAVAAELQRAFPKVTLMLTVLAHAD